MNNPAEKPNAENLFIKSLDEMTEDDFINGHTTDKPAKKKNKKSLVSTIISIVFLIVCAVVFVYCAYQIILSVSDYVDADTLYESFSQQYADAMQDNEDVAVYNLSSLDLFDPMKNYTEIAKSGADTYDPSVIRDNVVTSPKFQRFLVFLNDLKVQNNDVYGYINIEGTQISLPMLQSDDNEYYLNHGINGEILKAGAIFVDFRNSKTITENRNTVIYGHNMSNGAMFHDLTNYLDENFFYNQPIVISTFDGIYTYRVFSIHEADAKENYFRTSFAGNSDFVNFCNTMESQSMYHLSDLNFTSESTIITLSTCIQNNLQGRYAIHAILVNVER